MIPGEVATWPAVELRRRAMGTDIHVRLTGESSTDPAQLSGILIELDRRLDDIERRWSRFQPTSEVSRLNRRAGESVYVSGDTQLLIARAISSWRLTAGAYDPTVHDAVVAAGYDRSFESLAERHPRSEGGGRIGAAAPGCDGIEVDYELGSVTLPEGCAVDPGGIGKGLAADLIADYALSGGASGVLVSLGGDLRVAGQCDDGLPGWLVQIAEPGAEEQQRVSLIGGGVASTTPLRRRWPTAEGPMHHLIDPATGNPTGGFAPRLVTVVAGEAWLAEVLTKAVHVRWARGERTRAEETLALANASALVVDVEGERHLLVGMEEYLT